jgi:hypothetical protein
VSASVADIERRTVPELERPGNGAPGAERLEALRAGAVAFRERFRAAGRVEAVRTLDLVSAPLASGRAFGGLARGGPTQQLRAVSRLVVVRFRDFEGESRTLCWQPATPDGMRRTPHQLGADRHRGHLTRRAPVVEHQSPRGALERCGLDASEIDLVALPDLHATDLRTLAGSTRAVEGEHGRRPPLFPLARVLFQRRERDALERAHPALAAWYVPRGTEHAVEDALVALEGDVELGPGVALIGAPGPLNGGQSLVLGTAAGVWVISANGVAADNWHPHLSKIPGLARAATHLGREVAGVSTAVQSSTDQYDAMIVEKTLADPNRSDPRWMNVAPARGLVSVRAQWPVIPSHVHEPLTVGRMSPGGR